MAVTKGSETVRSSKSQKSRRSCDQRLSVYQSKAKSHSMNRIDLLKRPDASRVSNILRKEVIQPQVPLRLPCYDLVPIAKFIFGA